MQRVTRSTAAPSLPSPPASPGPPGYFTGGDPLANVPPTVPGYEWFNGVQEELVGLLVRAGLTPDGADLAQVRKALDRLYGGGLRTVSSNLTLAADDAGVVLADAAAASRTITLPAANAANGRPLRFTFVRVDGAGANAVVLARAGADTIEGLTQISLGVGRRLTMVSDGASAWRVVAANGPRGEMQVYTGSAPFTVPAGVTRIRVRVVGAGGGGGRGTGTNAAAGGGAGGYAEGWYDVTPGSTYMVTVGAGGSGATSPGAAGSPGGTTSFGDLLSATGGSGQSPLEAGGSGGYGVGGQINAGGGDGLDATGGAPTMGGGGGNSVFGGGGRAGTVAGGNAKAFGAGGGGSYGPGTPGNGGSGAHGVCIVEWWA
jgi:hypothetical protein